MHDVLIRNATIYDGSGCAPRVADLAIAGSLISALGPIPDPAGTVIDAAGLALMPGIIDNHTHYDAQITWDRTLQPSSALGVTTVILGNCGFTIAPCKSNDREITMRNLTQVEGMPLEALRKGIRWDFESFPQYLNTLEAHGTLLNVAAYVGHSSVRTYVMGSDAARRAARPDEVEQMVHLVWQAMEAGAIGFATSTSPAHNGEGGLPMPSRLAGEDELLRLTGCLKSAGRGVFMLTKGGQTRLEFLEHLCADSGRPVIVAALLHNKTNPDQVFDELDYLRRANERGRTMLGAVSCCPLTMDFTFASPYPLEGLDAWKPALGLNDAAYRAILADSAFRDAVRAELARPARFRLFNGEWHEVRVAEAQLQKNRILEQQSIAEVAALRGEDPLDLFLDVAREENLRTVFTATLLNSDEEAVGRLITHPASLVSLSDAGAHLTFFTDAGFGLHLIGRWARDRGKLTVEEAVRRLTSQPAQLFGIKGRGLLRPGYAADLVLFDPATVGRGPRRKVADLPGGASRLHTDAIGLHGVWVNGRRIVDEKGLLAQAASDGALPGQLIRDFE